MKPDSKLDVALEEIVARWGIPGLAVGITDNNGIIYAGSFGVQSLETQTPVTPGSVFCLASIAKCFVASAIMQLVEQGKLELDAPLVQYLPYFRLDDERYQQITLRQILSHTSGMPDMNESEYDELVAHPEYDDGAAERYVRSLSARKMIGTPGERFAYSNIAYNVLGVLIAKISGQSFENYMSEHILRPAGMPDSTFFFPDVPLDRLAVPHLRTPQMMVNPIYPYHRADAPASFLYSTVTDMCHWAITSLKRGIYQEERILTPASYDLMWTPIAQRGVPPYREEMGLGWTLGHFEGIGTIGHGGGGFGWTCLLVLLPEIQRAAIILSNEESSAHERAMEAVIHALLGKEPQPGDISWMIPIAKALQTGGIQAAYACYDEIKHNPDYLIDADELFSLFYQLMSAKEIDLAFQVMELNLYAFPENLGLHLFLARRYLHHNNPSRAKTLLQKALVISPENKTAIELLEKIG